MPLTYPIIGNRYWSANGSAATAVAVAGEANDWAAYIAGVPYEQEEVAAAEWTSKFGCKLAQEEAEALFPQVARSALIYRG